MVTLDAPETNSKCPLLNEPSGAAKESLLCPFGAVRPATPGFPSLIWSLPLGSFTPLPPPFLVTYFDSVKSLRRRRAPLFISQTRGDARPMPLTRRDHDSLAKRLCFAERPFSRLMGPSAALSRASRASGEGSTGEHSACR